MIVDLITFDQELATPDNRKYNLIFMGMSGSGKTHWSERMSSECQYKRVEIDHLIGEDEALSKHIAEYPGKDNAEKMGNFFGMPWTDGFEEKEKIFLDAEKRILQLYLGSQGTIIDLSGSGIYHPEELKILSKTGVIIYLETNKNHLEEMLQTYLKNPKPVCWNGHYAANNNEDKEDALERCYHDLLEDRAEKYANFADITLPHTLHKNFTDIRQFIKAVRSEISNAQT